MCAHAVIICCLVKLCDFHTTQYNMSDETVKQCLSHQYGMKLHRHTSQVNDEMRTHEWPQFVQDVVEHDDIDIMDEYICIHCKNSLQQKKKNKMPDQACANGLQLHDIPQDLQNIIPLERRVISLQILFITILIMRQYGGHYKVNGSPVNVPATLDQITDIFPCMPSDLQLHPIKLKCKLESKSHYMYDMICRDHVISAITWLKEHNSNYADIQLNEHWYIDIAVKELSVQIDENDSHITMTDDDIFDQPLQKENTTTDKLNTKDNEQLCTKQRVESMSNESDDEDMELVEEQAAVNCRQELTGDPLPSVLQFENLENQIYPCTPGENNIPKYMLLDNDFEVIAFPDLFPYGGCG